MEAHVVASPLLVGRGPELEAVCEQFEAARAGRGGVVALAGEPGIGKTALARRFAQLAREHGVAVLWGTCLESEGAPAYAPWRQILSALPGPLRTRPGRRGLGPSLAVIAELVPELSPGRRPTSPAPLAPQEARLRLFDAIVRVLRATDEPLALVLDDLHWADPSSIALLEYVGRAIGGSHVLAIAAYRDELDLAHPLAQCLAELRRTGVLRSVPVGRLSAGECGELLAFVLGAPASCSLVQAVYAETSGNPFYTAELARQLEEEGVDPGASADAASWRTPEGVRHSVGRRVARLSLPARRTLEVGAGFTGGFDFRTLQALVPGPEDELLDALDEALRAKLVRPLAAETYDFEHAIVRHALYDELSPSRRARVHRRIAEAIEHVHAGNASEHAPELAAQYHRSASLPGAAHGIRFALLAAEAASRAHAQGEAVAFLRMARGLARDADASVRADILCRLAGAEADAVMVGDARRTVDEALASLADAGAEPERVAEFLQRVAWALKDAGAEREILGPLVARGLAIAAPGCLVWARLKLIESPLELVTAGGLTAGRWLGFDPKAVAIARAGSQDDYARTLELMDWRSRSEVDALLTRLRGWELSAATLHALTVCVRSLVIQHGAFREGLEESRRLQRLAARAGSLPARAYGELYAAFALLALGDLAAARASGARADELIARLGHGHRLHPSHWFFASLAAVLTREPAPDGEGADAEDPAPSPWMVVVNRSIRALACALAGDEEEARRLVRAVIALLGRMPATTLNQKGATAFAAAAVWELADEELAPPLRRLALDLVACGVGDYPTTSNELTVARTASLAGDAEEAGAYFVRACEKLRASGQRPLEAIAFYDEALALRRSRGTVPADPLEAARTRFERLAMPAWAERAAELAGVAGASRPDGLTPRETEILGLLAAGRTNREIAGELFLSVHTVERHVANVYAKIRVRNRADAAAYAARRGL